MNLALNVPLNSVSFGQTSTALLREMKKRSLDPSIFPIGGQVDLSTQEPDHEFDKWVQKNCQKAPACHSRDIPTFKLSHLNGSLESFSEKQTLLSFYELDQPTPAETNVARNHNTIFTSEYTCEAFMNAGVQTHYVPLFFDNFNFKSFFGTFYIFGKI